MKAIEFYKKYIQPFIAILILILLIFSVTLLSKEHSLKREISENCGWGEENYRCYCEKGEAIRIQNLMNNNLELDDVKLDR